MDTQIKFALERLELWLEQNGFWGWDPYDVEDSRIYRFIEHRFPTLIRKILIRLLSEFNHIFPITFRKIMGVKKAVNNKALGLMLSGYSKLYETTKNTKYLKQAINIANYLEQNSNADYAGMSWGYPFDWKSPILIPAEVPSSVVTSVVGDGFYQLYKVTGDKKYLNICKKVCEFFMQDLTLTYQDNSKSCICFSYTPLDDYQVHNANLFVAEFLIRIGTEINNKIFIDTGIASAKFALTEQQEEGYLPYWGLSQTKKYSRGKIHTDHYHCGFEIRSLHAISVGSNISEFKIAYEKYFAWYRQNMFEVDNSPKFMADRLYPINIHTSAEAILCCTRLAQTEQELLTARCIALDVISLMEFKPGEYVHVIREVAPFVKIKSKIPMLRWGQAWMFLALAELYCATEKLQKLGND